MCFKSYYSRTQTKRHTYTQKYAGTHSKFFQNDNNNFFSQNPPFLIQTHTHRKCQKDAIKLTIIIIITITMILN